MGIGQAVFESLPWGYSYFNPIQPLKNYCTDPALRLKSTIPEHLFWQVALAACAGRWRPPLLVAGWCSGPPLCCSSYWGCRLHRHGQEEGFHGTTWPDAFSRNFCPVAVAWRRSCCGRRRRPASEECWRAGASSPAACFGRWRSSACGSSSVETTGGAGVGGCRSPITLEKEKKTLLNEVKLHFAKRQYLRREE